MAHGTFLWSSVSSDLSNLSQNRKPSFWVVLAEPKSNRLVVPPTRIYDVPYSSEKGREDDRDYRSYKIQFQGPNGIGTFGWKIFVISDTFVGEEVSRNLTVSELVFFLERTQMTHP